MCLRWHIWRSYRFVAEATFKIKVFWNKGYGVIISAYEATNKILSYDSVYIINVVVWLKFGNSSTSMREVIITSIF